MEGQQERRNLQNLIVRNIEKLSVEALRKIYALTVQLSREQEAASAPGGAQPGAGTAPAPAASESKPSMAANIVGQEKRVFKRLDTNVPIKYRILGTMDVEGTRVVSEDLSGGGTRFVILTEEDIQTGFLLELEIFLPLGSGTIVSQAKVVWVKPMEEAPIANNSNAPPDEAKKKRRTLEVGLEFIDITREDRVNIARYVHMQEMEKKRTRGEQVKPKVAADLGAFLLQKLKAPDAVERENACRSIGEQKDPRAIGALKSIIENDPSAQVREAAKRAIKKITGEEQ